MKHCVKNISSLNEYGNKYILVKDDYLKLYMINWSKYVDMM